MSNKIERVCKNCQKEFLALRRDVNRGWGNFCSRACSATYNNKRKKKKGTWFSCEVCGKNFYRNPSTAKRKPCRACNKSCSAKLRIGKKSNHWKGGKSYRAKAFRVKPAQCERCGWNIDKRGLVVHHKDRNRENNKLENLEILCGGCHRIEHYNDWHPAALAE